MDKYREFVKILAQNRLPKEFLNSDEEHALEVFVNLFEQAKDCIRILAGCLCGELANASQYIVALSDFIERGGEVLILLNKYQEEEIVKSRLMRRLSYYLSDSAYSGKIKIKSTTQKFYYANDESKKEVHFTVADKRSYRIETDIQKRTATCNFNNSEGAEHLILLFDKVFDAAESVDISSILNN